MLHYIVAAVIIFKEQPIKVVNILSYQLNTTESFLQKTINFLDGVDYQENRYRV